MRASFMYPVLAGTLTVAAFWVLRAAGIVALADWRVMLIAGCYGYLLSRLPRLLAALAVRRRRRMLQPPVLPLSDAPFGDMSGKVVSIRDARRKPAEPHAVPYGPWARNVLPLERARGRGRWMK